MRALEYHQSSKHDFHQFARSPGRLDWATQPDPFRRYAGAALIELPREAWLSRGAADVGYDALFNHTIAPAPVSAATIGELLRCSLALSAWKRFQGTRWALRVNPSSGNLHPTEGYLVWDAHVYHYAPREHGLESRAAIDRNAWSAFLNGRPGFLVGLSSILWRESWKYGERAFRYCQHDTGHAIAALRLAAAMLGWQVALLPRWSDAHLAGLLGLDRDEAFVDAEREEPECIAIVTAGDPASWLDQDPAPLAAAASAASWHGLANRLSPARVDWKAVDEVAAATRYPGRSPDRSTVASRVAATSPRRGSSVLPESEERQVSARDVFLTRRSAVAFDAHSMLPRAAFMKMLARLDPRQAPFDAVDWAPQVHLVIFVHRVEGLLPGIYACLRTAAVMKEWQAAMRPDFLWERIPNDPNAPNAPNASNDPNDPNDPNAPPALFLLAPIDMTWPANRVSCDQDIAGDGFFSLGMVSRFEQPLRERGDWFYRRLFWECGMIGQVLYLEAEAAGARGTGIGCFYDDQVHHLVGLTGHAWQSLYHFSMGVPVDDGRLTTEPAYPWDRER